jgi:hypothetical protein
MQFLATNSTLELFILRRICTQPLAIEFCVGRPFQQEHDVILLLVLQQGIFQIVVPSFEQLVNDALVLDTAVRVKVTPDCLLDTRFRHGDNVENLHHSRDLSVYSKIKRENVC